MNEFFSIEDIKTTYPDAIVDGNINYEKLALTLAQEVKDIQDQMMEKDFQILKITERLDKIGA